MGSVLSIKKRLVVASLLFFFGLGTVSAHEYSRKAKEEAEKIKPLPPIVVRVTGYGAYAASESGKADPKRLLAIRASKLDAYRNLAERVYGISIAGNSTVKDFMLEHDGFATAVDTVIRGARVVSISENQNTGIETVLELILPGEFQDCLNKVNSFKNGSNCLRPLSEMRADASGMAGMQSRSRPQDMESVYFLQ